MSTYDDKDANFFRSFRPEDDKDIKNVLRGRDTNRFCLDCMRVQLHSCHRIDDSKRCWYVCSGCGRMEADIPLPENSDVYVVEPKTYVRDIAKEDAKLMAAYENSEASEYFTWEQWADMGYAWPKDFDRRRLKLSRIVSSKSKNVRETGEVEKSYCVECGQSTQHIIKKFKNFNWYTCSKCESGYTIETVTKHDRAKKAQNKKENRRE